MSQSRFRVAASATPGGSGAGGRKRAAPSGGNGGGDGPGASQAAKKRKMTRWNEATMACLCSCLIELTDAGKQTDYQGFKAADLQNVSRTLQEQCGADFDAKQIRSKWDDMKAKWKEWCRHLGRVSGWGQDPNGVPFNEKEIEDAYFTQHPDSKIFRRKAPAFRDQMETLLGHLGATQATCQHATSLDQTLMGGEGGDDDDDDEGGEDLLGEMMISMANGLGPQADGGAAAAGGEGGGDGDDGLDDAGSEAAYTLAVDTSIETIGDNDDDDTPSNPAHRGNTSARGNATNIPGRLTTPRPSTTRSHRKEDAAASSFERTMNRSTAVLADIARLQERAQERNAVPAVPMGSALTRATARISALEFVVGLDVRRRMSVIRAMAKDGNADIVLGLRDEDMQPYVEMLLEEMAGPPPAPPQQQQQ
ncbi:hypothetical protein E4U19_007058 [Claviceps sp. Clav32 group G5]|nr:hypothetical protein E4U19_007058 [Claviceps sp. Clav32 group G5]KAG6039519.1 hypothetical protein E4U39_007638 [Claviceps sp. Clav50 group G5]